MIKQLRTVVTLILIGAVAFIGYSLIWDSPGELAPVDYVRWVEDPENGLSQSFEGPDVSFVIQYKPIPYIIANEQRKVSLEEKLVRDRAGELEGLQYYNLRLRSTQGNTEVFLLGNSSQKDYFTKSDYYAYTFRNDIKLVENGDTLPCLLYQMVQSYGVAPHLDFVLAFESSDKEEQESSNKSLLILDRVFQNGLVSLEIDGLNIDQIPSLITE